MIAWQQFSPWPAFLGGLLIGLAAAILILFNGRVAGVSGILGSLLAPRRREYPWQLLFILGLVIAPMLFRLFAPLPTVVQDASLGLLGLAGLLVGIGTRIGSGCTSGHGVCGLSRLSLRSLAATLLFMLAGMGTVYVVHHILNQGIA